METSRKNPSWTLEKALVGRSRKVQVLNLQLGDEYSLTNPSLNTNHCFASVYEDPWMRMLLMRCNHRSSCTNNTRITSKRVSFTKSLNKMPSLDPKDLPSSNSHKCAKTPIKKIMSYLTHRTHYPCQWTMNLSGLETSNNELGTHHVHSFLPHKKDSKTHTTRLLWNQAMHPKHIQS